jgi:hypothetical protein
MEQRLKSSHGNMFVIFIGLLHKFIGHNSSYIRSFIVLLQIKQSQKKSQLVQFIFVHLTQFINHKKETFFRNFVEFSESTISNVKIAVNSDQMSSCIFRIDEEVDAARSQD